MLPLTAHSITALPKASNLQEIHEISSQLEAVNNGALSDHATALLYASAGNAPYLARLIHKHPELFLACAAGNYEAKLAAILAELAQRDTTHLSENALMTQLRHAKEQVALCAAMLEIAHENALMLATRALSDFAQTALSSALQWLLHQAARRGDITIADMADVERDSGIIILGMGKFGAHELNYSSDIDLIILFDPEKLRYIGNKNTQHFMNKLVQELIHIMQERTEHGYVFRTDIRLRPDPASTPPAVNLAAALAYYETLGQNWERAAMIKARPVAGDIAAGDAFLHALTPYIWRKSLDYAALDDIYSIKRQMHSGNEHAITLPGHNVKTGVGGIREIEFYVQTQQLVWGGRTPDLRVRGTLEGLAALLSAQLIDQDTHDELCTHYLYLRTLEHRLQMHNDAQTHSLPEQTELLENVACFIGTPTEIFEQHTLETLESVHRIYQASMQDSTPLGHEGKLVFTGVEADQDTLQTLSKMGFAAPERVWQIIQLWHRGNRRATKTARARRELTEITPLVLQTLANTTSPDKAFAQFDDFLSKLPAGVQIFSLLHAHPYLMQLIADILGSAPALGATLGGNPLLLDAVLDADFFDPLPDRDTLSEQLVQRLSLQEDIEQAMIFLRVFHNEKRFQAGMHMLKHLASPSQVSTFLSDLAQVILQHTMQLVLKDYGRGAEQFPISILALGKLGAREMTFNSDLDIMFIYTDDDTTPDIRTHMHRISQRIINALTLMMREGRLYEVDTRLRPGGADGPIATSLASLDDYFTNSAWTFEHMAITKARIVASTNEDITVDAARCIRKHVTKQRDQKELANDAAEMRARLHKQFGTSNPYDVKYIDGGLIDIDFFAQSLTLVYAHAHPTLYQHSTALMLEEACQAGLLERDTVTAMKESTFFLNDALSIQRLCMPGGVLSENSPTAHTRTLAKAMGIADANTLTKKLRWHQQRISDMIHANNHLITGA